MKCDTCGSEYDPNENPKFRECPGHGAFRIGPAVLRPGVIEPEHVLCGRCGKSYGDVGELIEKAGLFDSIGASPVMRGEPPVVSDLRAQVATLTKERDDLATRLSNQVNQTVYTGLDLEKAIRERDDAREKQAESEHNILSLNEYYLSRITELEKAELKLQSVKGGDSMVIKANGTWEWRKV